MPIIHVEGFETSLFTLLGMSQVLWRRKADNTLSNPCFMALPLNFTTSAFPIPNYFTLKNFLLEVVAIGRKNAGKDPDTFVYSLVKYVVCMTEPAMKARQSKYGMKKIICA